MTPARKAHSPRPDLDPFLTRSWPAFDPILTSWGDLGSTTQRAQRSKKFEISSEIENFERDWKFRASHPPRPYFLCWNRDVEIEIFERDQKFRSRSKFSSEIEFFWSLGPLGKSGQIQVEIGSERGSKSGRDEWGFGGGGHPGRSGSVAPRKVAILINSKQLLECNCNFSDSLPWAEGSGLPSPQKCVCEILVKFDLEFEIYIYIWPGSYSEVQSRYQRPRIYGAHQGGRATTHPSQKGGSEGFSRPLSRRSYPDLPILAFFVFLAFFVLRFSSLFCAFLLSSSKDFKGSAERKILAFFGGSSLFGQ